MNEELKVGDTVRPLSGGPLLMVEGFEPYDILKEGRMDEKGLVRCVVIYTGPQPRENKKERFKLPRIYLEKPENRLKVF